MDSSISSPRRILLCADDYGLHPAVDAGIRSLIAGGRLGATSCMTLAPGWPEAAKALAPLRGRAEVGLHFALTEPFPGQPHEALGGLILRAFGGRLDAVRLQAAWRAQLDAFEAHWGAAPDYVDGHQHVHQLPVIREIMLAELMRRYPGQRPWLRVTVPARWQGVKAQVIALLGGYGLRARLRRLDWRHNTDFLGVYDFTPGTFPAQMARWLASARDGALIMCHPGERGDYPLPESRPMEQDWLAGEGAEMALREAGVVLVPALP